MRKKIVPVIILVLLFLAGLIALTQEADNFNPVPGILSESSPYKEGEDAKLSDGVLDIVSGEQWLLSDEETAGGDNIYNYYEFADNAPEWITAARWFRSNAGGMALEEIPSRLAALRNEYALVIDFINREELPKYLFEYYNNNYYIEIRALYKNGEESRKQWIFRDNRGITRLIAVFSEPENNDVKNVNEVFNDADFDNGAAFIGDEESKKENEKEKAGRNGFMEIFDEKGFITSEYRFFDDGRINKNEYKYSNGIIITASAMFWEENEEGGEFAQTHIDYYRYNRSSFLRSIERVFYMDRQISPVDESVMISFPGNIMSAAKIDNFISEKINPYPEFFGDMSVHRESRIVFTTDERGRVLHQTFYDEDDSIIWIIQNTWRDDRIVSAAKTEDGIVYLAEYEYDIDGNRILERNLRDGILERLVRTEGSRDIEYLYINNIIVLQAVWEDGRKISETRVR